MFIDATNLFGHSRSQLLPFDEIKFERNVSHLKMFLTNMWKKIKLKIYITLKREIYDWTDKKKYFVLYTMFEFYLRRGKVVDKVYEIN